MNRPSFLKQFNWRALLVRILINAVVLAVTALILPNVYFVEITVRNILFIAIALGVLNAIIKPILQFLTLSFIFTTYGLVVILINAVILWLLALLFPDRFAVDSILAALLGGALIGILGSFFESLFGLSPPIGPDEQVGLGMQSGDHTPVVTKMILKTEHKEKPALADPAAPLVTSSENGLPAEEPAQADGEEALAESVVRVSQPLPEAEEPDDQAVVEDEPITEEAPAIPDMDNVETPELPVKNSDDDQSDIPAQAEENESWQ